MRWNATELKLLMVFLMVLDHIYEFIPGTPIWFTYLGRLVAPVFYFLLAESYHYTRNRIKLIERLYLFGLIMLAGNILITYIMPSELGIPNNIFMNMALCLTFLECMERMHTVTDGRKRIVLTTVLLLSLVLLFFTEGNYFTLAFLLVFHYLRERTKQRDIAYGLIALAMTNLDFSYASLFLYNYQWMMVFSIVFFRIYNGERGRGLKYAFYFFYPMHIWLLYIISQMLQV